MLEIDKKGLIGNKDEENGDGKKRKKVFCGEVYK
jgi:hypothetical protein